eukprot:875000-Ditylum_brightwellii.AAC.1
MTQWEKRTMRMQMQYQKKGMTMTMMTAHIMTIIKHHNMTRVLIAMMTWRNEEKGHIGKYANTFFWDNSDKQAHLFQSR